jgi:uncharacterized protein YwgA
VDIVDRCQKIIELLDTVGGSVKGRKKLQKIIYLLQAAGEDFDQDYVFWHYGVFSKTLASDLAYLVSSGIVEESLLADSPYETYEVKLATSVSNTHSALSERANMAKKLAEEEPRTLELLSTIVYLNGQGLRNGTLSEEVKRRKGHLLSEADNAVALAKDEYSISLTL